MWDREREGDIGDREMEREIDIGGFGDREREMDIGGLRELNSGDLIS